MFPDQKEVVKFCVIDADGFLRAVRAKSFDGAVELSSSVVTELLNRKKIYDKGGVVDAPLALLQSRKAAILAAREGDKVQVQGQILEDMKTAGLVAADASVNDAVAMRDKMRKALLGL